MSDANPPPDPNRRRLLGGAAAVATLAYLSRPWWKPPLRNAYYAWETRDIPVTRNSVIDVVYLGGPDCPVCMAWKQYELPRLLALPEFPLVRFTEVVKTIPESVPAAAVLPEHLRPIRPELVRVIRHDQGSPMFALLVAGRGVHGGVGAYDYAIVLAQMRALAARKAAAA